MSLALVYDTETTGLPLFDQPSEHPDQPHIVQLAACLVDLDTRKTLASMDVIVRPGNWTIPADVAAIHGISTEHARDVGISESLALEMFLELWVDRLRIAHNETFDARIVRIALLRHNQKIGLNPERWKACKSECTQLLSTPILKLPPTERMRAAGRNHYKSANLREAYKHFTGRDHADAHSAMADVQACLAVYFAIEDLKQQTESGAA